MPFRSVDEYLDSQPAGTRQKLVRIRSLIRKAAPRAEERIAYDIPGYELEDRPLLYFAGWKKHYSLYPLTPAVAAALGGRLDPFEIEKDTIRFSLTGALPEHVIGDIVLARVDEVRREIAAASSKTSSSSSKKAAAKTTSKKETKKVAAKTTSKKGLAPDKASTRKAAPKTKPVRSSKKKATKKVVATQPARSSKKRATKKAAPARR